MSRTQTLAVTLLNLRSLPQRWGAAAVAVVGIGGVVLVLVATLAVAQGFRQALEVAGAEDVGVIVRAGSNGELSSTLTGAETTAILDTAGVARDAAGPIASPELYVLIDLPTRGLGTPANVPLRGVGPRAGDVRERFRIVAGRAFVPGLNEVIVGRGAAAQFRGVDVGAIVRFASQDWHVVGLFEDGGSVSESELWTDVHVLQSAYERGNSYQSVRARLTSRGIEGLRQALAAEPRVNVTATTEKAFYAEQSRVLVALVTTVGAFIAAMMGVGAVFGALNTMYSAVAARTREIATLRALGFGAMPVVVSVLVESLVLGLVGGLLGGAAAYAAFNGYTASTLNFQTFSQLTFAFAVTPGVLVTGITYALLLGFVGGLLPGLRAARMSVTAGLRAA